MLLGTVCVLFRVQFHKWSVKLTQVPTLSNDIEIDIGIKFEFNLSNQFGNSATVLVSTQSENKFCYY